MFLDLYGLTVIYQNAPPTVDEKKLYTIYIVAEMAFTYTNILTKPHCIYMLGIFLFLLLSS
jgi:hypothetical protein